jgi:sugar lactone lactonase YvrE
VTGARVLRPEVLADGFGFLEGPRWFDGSLWVSDFATRRVHRVSPAGESTTVASVPGRPSGLGFADGQLLVSVMEDQAVVAVAADGVVRPHADLTGVAVGLCNDMLVDDQGRAYVGCMGFDLFRGDRPNPGNVVLVDPQGGVREVASDMHVPNGTVLDSKGRLIIAETNGKRLTRFTVGVDGALSARTIHAQFDDYGPDGLCIDAADGIWMGACFQSAFVYVLPDGRTTHIIETPGRWAVACALGGEDMQTLFILTADTSMRRFRHDESTARIEAVRVDTPGVRRSGERRRSDG